MFSDENYDDPTDPRSLDPDEDDEYLKDVDTPDVFSASDRSDPDDIERFMALSEREEESGPIGDEGSIQQLNFGGPQEANPDWPAGDAPPVDPDQYLTGSEDESAYGAM